ncbi:MAG: oligosaccharide flippase family protein [Patescibacteria group bacterium]
MESLPNKPLSLLKRAERILKLDTTYIARGSVWMTLSFVIGTLASLVTMVAYGNLLSRETYGTYNYLLSLGASLSFLTLSGTGFGVLRAVARGYENVVPVALRLQLKYNLIAVATVLSVAIYYGYKGNMLFAYSLLLLAVAYPLAEAFHIYVQVLNGRKRFDLLTKLTSIITLIGTVATVATLLATQSILILIAVYAATSLLPSVFLYWYVTKDIDKTSPDEEQIREMRRTAFHITGAGLVGTAAQYIDKILLFQVAGPAALAVYGFATAGPDRLRSFLKNAMSITLPRLAQSSLEQIRQVVYKRIALSMLFGFGVALIYWFLAPYLFKLLLPRYLDAILYTQVLALSLIAAPVVIYVGSIFAGQNMLRGNYALSIGTQIIRITLFVILGWKWQIWGLVFAYLSASILNAILSIIIWEIEARRLIRKNE